MIVIASVPDGAVAVLLLAIALAVLLGSGGHRRPTRRLLAEVATGRARAAA